MSVGYGGELCDKQRGLRGQHRPTLDGRTLRRAILQGRSLLDGANRQVAALARTAELLRSRPEEVPGRVEEALARLRERERELERLQAQLARRQGEELASLAQDVGGVRVVAAEAPVGDGEALRRLGDAVRDRLGSGIVLLGAPVDGKVLFLAMVTSDLVARGFHAGKIVAEMARVAGGGGGGRPEMAQAGGRDAARLREALAAGVEAVRRRSA